MPMARQSDLGVDQRTIKTVLDATSDYALTKIPAGNGTLAVADLPGGDGL